MNFLDWSRAFGAVAIAALCVTGYNAATGGYGGAGLSLPDFNLHLPSGGSTGGSAGSAAPTVNWQLRNAASVPGRGTASVARQGAFAFDSDFGIPRIVLTPDDQYLIATDQSSFMHPPGVWQTSDGTALPTLAAGPEAELVPSFTEDGRAVMVGIQPESVQNNAGDGTAGSPLTMRVTDIVTGEVIRSLTVPKVPNQPGRGCGGAVSSYARVVACVHFSGKTASWDLLRGEFLAAWDVTQHRSDKPIIPIKTFALSADGSALAVKQEVDSSKRAVGDALPPITIWNTANGAEIGRLQVSQPVEALALMPNGRELLTVLGDGSVWITTIATSGSERLAQLALDPTLTTNSGIRPVFTVNSSINGESVVATYSVFRENEMMTGSSPAPPQVIRVDLKSRKQVRYEKFPFVGGQPLVGVAVPSRENWLVVTYAGGSIYKIVPGSDLSPNFKADLELY